MDLLMERIVHGELSKTSSSPQISDRDAQQQYTKVENFTIHACTWNVNGRAPLGNEHFSELNFRKWLVAGNSLPSSASLHRRSSASERANNNNNSNPTFSSRLTNNNSVDVLPDFLVVGLQELDVRKEALVFGETPREADWLVVIERTLRYLEEDFDLSDDAADLQYQLIAKHRLVGMMLLVFAQARHAPFITEIAAASLGTGLMKRFGNKGGVALRFNFHAKSLCFVNSHLAAHVEHVERRNEDYRTICQDLLFSIPTRHPKTNVPIIVTRMILEHDVVLWLGDLNYRLDFFDRVKAEMLLNNNRCDVLLQHDQLRKQIVQGTAFQDFSESPIMFMPTYKYDIGTSKYDSSTRMRVPAWCDRILYRVRRDVARDIAIDVQTYDCLADMEMSDHKPVKAQLVLRMQVIDTSKCDEIIDLMLSQSDYARNRNRPCIALERHEVRFRPIGFLEECEFVVRVRNVSRVPAHFSLAYKKLSITRRSKLPKMNAVEEKSSDIQDNNAPDNPAGPPSDDKPLETAVTGPAALGYGTNKSWLSIYPPEGDLLPGEKCKLYFKVAIDDPRLIMPCLSGREKLEDFIIVHVDGGNDVFLAISGKLKPTPFGLPLSVIITLDRPIEDYDSVSLRDRLCNQAIIMNNADSPPVEAVPCEILILFNDLYKRGLQTENLFYKSNPDDDLKRVMQHVAAHTPRHEPLPASEFVSAECLLLLLDCLPVPVIPRENYDTCLAAFESYEACCEALELVPRLHRLTFAFIMAFLREYLRYSGSNLAKPRLLANLFGTVLLKPLDENWGVVTGRSKFDVLGQFTEQNDQWLPRRINQQRLLKEREKQSKKSAARSAASSSNKSKSDAETTATVTTATNGARASNESAQKNFDGVDLLQRQSKSETVLASSMDRLEYFDIDERRVAFIMHFLFNSYHVLHKIPSPNP